VFGISLHGGASGALTDVTTSHNGVHGLDLETGSAATMTGALTASFNGMFGINVNGSSITFAQAKVVANNNALGVQIATSANAFINDSASAIDANNNLSTGLTVVSWGAHGFLRGHHQRVRQPRQWCLGQLEGRPRSRCGVDAQHLQQR
jgi:hypothetical protein